MAGEKTETVLKKTQEWQSGGRRRREEQVMSESAQLHPGDLLPVPCLCTVSLGDLEKGTGTNKAHFQVRQNVRCRITSHL